MVSILLKIKKFHFGIFYNVTMVFEYLYILNLIENTKIKNNNFFISQVDFLSFMCKWNFEPDFVGKSLTLWKCNIQNFKQKNTVCDVFAYLVPCRPLWLLRSSSITILHFVKLYDMVLNFLLESSYTEHNQPRHARLCFVHVR